MSNRLLMFVPNFLSGVAAMSATAAVLAEWLQMGVAAIFWLSLIALVAYLADEECARKLLPIRARRGYQSQMWLAALVAYAPLGWLVNKKFTAWTAIAVALLALFVVRLAIEQVWITRSKKYTVRPGERVRLVRMWSHVIYLLVTLMATVGALSFMSVVVFGVGGTWILLACISGLVAFTYRNDQIILDWHAQSEYQ